MKPYHFFAAVLLGLYLVGCSAMGVIETSDPMKKLAQANALVVRYNRPLPAEKLIREAIEICTNTNDKSCLGAANMSYSFFLRSEAVTMWYGKCRENCFRDKSVTIENRYVKAIEYNKLGISNYEQVKKYDMLSNAYLNLGVLYEYLKNKKEACASYAKALENLAKNIKENPDANVSFDPGPGISSFEDEVAFFQKRAGCIKGK